MSRVVLAMSGGVDSSVAAHLLQRAGHEVIGVFMRHGEAAVATSCATSEESASPAELPIISAAPHHKQGCCSASDAEDARRVADRLGIPFYAINFQEEFGEIIDYFVAEYTRARTPNPCVVCNTWLKFGKLFEFADGLDAEYVATGHYARLLPRDSSGASASLTRRASEGIFSLVPRPCIDSDEHAPTLCRGLDEKKDQSYVLFGIARELLSRMLLPVGEYRKEEIRGMAAELGLRVAEKKDSQEICFVPNQDHASFIRKRTGLAGGGEIVTTAGDVVGEHAGIEQFTVGQRKGLGVALGEPRFVVRIEPDTRRVVIGEKHELACTELTASGCNWLQDVPSEPFKALVQIRYNARHVPATIKASSRDSMRVTFDEPQFGVAPGQAAVCYDGSRVLGGGWID